MDKALLYSNNLHDTSRSCLRDVKLNTHAVEDEWGLCCGSSYNGDGQSAGTMGVVHEKRTESTEGLTATVSFYHLLLDERWVGESISEGQLLAPRRGLIRSKSTQNKRELPDLNSERWFNCTTQENIMPVSLTSSSCDYLPREETLCFPRPTVEFQGW